MKVLGETEVSVKYKNQEAKLPLAVVKGRGPSLLGRNWLKVIQLDWRSIKHIPTELESLLYKYDELFKEELGTMRGVNAKLSMKEDATPKFCRARPVPYALREAIEKDLSRMQQLGVIERVSYSDWATPVVPVPKPDGSVRLCGDFKVTVNPVLQVGQYPIPQPEDLLTALTGGQKFSKLDLSQAYQQMILEPEHRKFTTINTHQGLCQYTRLPFGITSAPAIFHQAMEKILQGLPKVVCYLDDVLVTGSSDREHITNLEEVFRRLKERGLRLKKSKCSFMKPSVQYLGYLVDEGIHTSPEKVSGIVEAPRPANQQQLRAFLGLVNYYGKFLPSLSTTTYPLNCLLHKNISGNGLKNVQNHLRS